MIIKILGIICIICSIICIYSFLHYTKEIKNIHKLNANIDELNKQSKEIQNDIDNRLQQVENLKNKLYNINKEINDKVYYSEQKINSLDKTIEDKQKYLDNIQQNVTKTIDSQKQLSQSAFENYCEILIKNYEEKEKEYEQSIQKLNDSYFNIQNNINKDLEQKKEDNQKYLEEEKQKIAEELSKEREILEKVRQTRAAALQAQLKEQEIKEKLSFYCLTIKDSELDDIKVLERVKEQLHAPRILSMLVWQTYFQKPMTSLCNNIIGTGVKSGVYKITNQKNNICYIGQATNLSDRWKQHAKCGLGIDTPVGNKLYKAMREDGLWNFSFEVLEFCTPAELNEKEKYYIELYQSKDYGYNSQNGNSK